MDGIVNGRRVFIEGKVLQSRAEAGIDQSTRREVGGKIVCLKAAAAAIRIPVRRVVLRRCARVREDLVNRGTGKEKKSFGQRLDGKDLVHDAIQQSKNGMAVAESSNCGQICNLHDFVS